MGSQLSAMAPTSIHPVDYYLTEMSEQLIFDTSLGSTRFFKVARVRIRDNNPHRSNSSSSWSSSFAVAKVFVIPDQSLPVSKYKNRLDRLRELLVGNPNALPFSRIIVIENKCGILLRQYIKYSLYDRLSTRPFLSFFEKKWITFQLLKCMQWIHRNGLTHGDIKLENIMVTSCLWILLSDFAVFKPTFLPDDNPSDFSFFFDTSRRRSCNVAPERFVKEDSLVDNLGTGNLDILSVGNNPREGSRGSTSSETSCGAVTPHMDLFSLGCVLAELFSDCSDFQLFDLSTILLYKNCNAEFMDKVNQRLNSVIPDAQVRLLIKNLISLDPSERNSTTQHLMELTPSLFPTSFNVLFDYIKELMHLSPDAKILRLESDLKSLVNSVINEEPQCLLLILVILTSTLRSLKHVYAKICCLRLIRRVVDADPTLMSGYLLDRVLPYILSVMTDPICPSVRREALETLTHTLSLVKEVTPSENNVFIDYILPVLNKVTADKSSFVRAALSSNIANLADIAMRFFHSSSQTQSEISNGVTNIGNTEEEMIESFKDMISHLLTDPCNEVKRALLDSNISKLCAFLGRTRTNDVILSHIITFLNDKEDFELRASFFDNIVPITAFLGSQCSSILKPLLQQGLSDAEEYVIHRTLQSLTILTSLKFLDRNLLFQLLSESSPLLCHPNPWIRHSLVSFVITLSEQLTLAETHCKLMPMIKRRLKKEINVLSPDLVLEYLSSCLSRDIYSMMISKSVTPPVLEAVFDIMKDQQHMRNIQTRHQTCLQTTMPSITNPSLSLYQKLRDNGMTEEIEEQLIDLSEIMIRISRNKSRSHPSILPTIHQKHHRRIGSNVSIKSDQTTDSRLKDPSFVMIETTNSQKYGSNNVVKLHSVPLIDDEKKVTTRIRAMTMSNMNDEWKHMFGSYTPSAASTGFSGNVDVTSSSMTATLTQSDAGSSVTAIESVLSDAQMTCNVIPVAHEAHELDFELFQTSCPPCMKSQRSLITHKKDSYEFSLWSRGVDLSNTLSFGEAQKSRMSGMRPRGCLIAHLHEHSKGINRIIGINNTNYFATCSDDGSLKTWDAGRIESAKLTINKSFQTTHSKDLSPFESMAYVYSLDTVIAISSKSEAHFFRLDSASSKLRQEHSLSLSKSCEDPSSVTSIVTDVVSLSPFCFAVSFSNSGLHGYDLRTDLSYGPAFRLSIDMRHGFITSITGTEYVIFAASSSGSIYTFDTRFMMRSSTVTYNESRRIRKLLFTPIGLFSSGKYFIREPS